MRSRIGGHALGDRIPAGDGQGPALAEGRLDIDDDQGPTNGFCMIFCSSSSLCHATYSAYSTGSIGGRPEPPSGGIQRAICL